MIALLCLELEKKKRVIFLQTSVRVFHLNVVTRETFIENAQYCVAILDSGLVRALIEMKKKLHSPIVGQKINRQVSSFERVHGKTSDSF